MLELEAHEVTCGTPGCPNHGIPVPVEVPTTDEDGAPASWSVVCGPCGAVLRSSDAP